MPKSFLRRLDKICRPVLLLSAISPFVSAADAEHWVATWAAAQPIGPTVQTYTPTQASVPPEKNRRELLPAAIPPTAPLERKTVRMIAHLSLGGRRLRIHFSSSYGTPGVWFSSGHVAVRDRDARISPATDRLLTFGGAKTLKMSPGAEMTSDPVDLEIPPQTDLAVTIFLPFYTGPVTEHQYSLHKTYIAENDVAAQTDLPGAASTGSYLWLSGVDVLAPRTNASVIAFGDSLTLGIGSTEEKNQDWPALLFARLGGHAVSVVNESLVGGRLLRDGPNVSGIARFDRDVLGRSGIKYLVVLLGSYDLGVAGLEHQDIFSSDLIFAYRQLIERARTHGIHVIGGTLPPFGGAYFYRKRNEPVRQAVNQWIRTSSDWDGLIDFDAALRDPSDPGRLNPAYDSGDHLNLNDAGYAAMAGAVSLNLFADRSGGS